MPISELAKKLDVPAHTLRYWEKEFPSLIVPTTGAGGRRYYRQETVSNLSALKKYLYADGYTIDGVKKLISAGDFSAVNKVQNDKEFPENFELHKFQKEDYQQNIQTAINLLKDAKKILAKN